MKTHPIKEQGLITVKNEAMDAYRRYLNDPTVDYRIIVKQESDDARRRLREKAKHLAILKLSSSRKSKT